MTNLRETRWAGPLAPMTREDMAEVLKPPFKAHVGVERLRDSHHNIARLAALGMKQIEIAARTGYSANRVNLLLQGPAMQDLVAHYRATVDESWRQNVDDYFQMVFTNMMRAERMIGDRLEEADEGDADVRMKDLIDIARDGADRTGYMKKSAQVVAKVDFASRLEAAIERNKKVIEVEPTPQGLRRAK